jgi:hypothetical protein
MAIFNPKARRNQPDPDFRYSSRERDLQIGCIFGGLALCFLACLVAGLLLEGLVKGRFWMAVFALLFVGLAILTIQSPQVVFDREGLHHPKTEETILWHQVAGIKIAPAYRGSSQLSIWLKEPDEHQACIRAWFSDRVHGTKESPLVFWLDRTSASYVWFNIKTLIGDTDHSIANWGGGERIGPGDLPGSHHRKKLAIDGED